MSPTEISAVGAADGASVLRVRGAVTLESARELQEACLEIRALPGEVLLDWSEATHLDAAALQVLLAFQAAMLQQGRSLTVRGDSDSIRRNLERAGLAHLFPEAAERS